MPLIIVGGQAKDVGKTTLICNIIAAFPTVKWTAIKVSGHHHLTEHCELLKAGAAWRIVQQSPAADQTDTARFLKSGADRALLIQADNHSVKEACSSLAQEISNAAAAIVESASAAQFLRHDLLLLLLDAAQIDFKDSAREQLGHADAFVLRNSSPGMGDHFDVLKKRPVFKAMPDGIDHGLFRMLAAKLEST